MPPRGSSTTAVEETLFLRGEDYFPEFLQRAAAFGDYGCGSYWGIRLDAPGEAFEWHPSSRELSEVFGDGPLAAWLAARQMYSDLDDESGSGA